MKIVDTVGDRLAARRPWNDEVVDANPLRHLGRTAAVLERPDEFSLGVDRDRRLVRSLCGPHLRCEVQKVRVPIRMLAVLARLDVPVQAGDQDVQQLHHNGMAHAMPERLEGRGQGASAQAGPRRRRFRIARRGWLASASRSREDAVMSCVTGVRRRMLEWESWESMVRGTRVGRV